MNKFKLLFYMGAAYPLFAKTDDAFGGAEVNLYYISTELARRGYKVEFVVSDYGQNDSEKLDGVRIIKAKYHALNKYIGISHKFLRRLQILHIAFKSPADVFFLSAASEMSAYLVFVAKIRKKKTLFRVAHDQDVNGYFTSGQGLMSKMFKYALPRFDRVVVQNEIQKTTLQNIEKIYSTVIKNGFPLDSHERPDKDGSILWVGRDEKFKRPMFFIELAERLGNQCIMILQGNSAYKKEIMDRADEVDNLIFVDHVSFFEIQHYFDRAICLVNTSDVEGFPNTFIQACIGATPILSFKVNPDSFIDSNNLGFVCDDNMEGAVEFIQSLSDEKVKKLGKKAFNYVKRNHNITQKADQYETILRELVNA